MGKRENLIEELNPIIKDSKRLEKFILHNSNLPSPRANLELAFALAEIYEDLDVLINWSEVKDEQAGINDSKSFLPFCAAVCLGKLYTKRKDDNIILILKRLANDPR